MKKDTVVVAVHDGLFHADDVTAVALAKHYYFICNVEVIRTRDPKKLAEADLVVDVGLGELDHHGPALEKAGFIVPGVHHCGASLLAQKLGLLREDRYPGLFSALVSISAQDNGEVCPPEHAKGAAFNFVHSFVPAWDSKESMDEAFAEAVDVAYTVLTKIVAKDNSAAAADNVLAPLAEQNQHIVELPAPGMPWQKHLAEKNTTYVVFQSKPGTWMVQCVPVAVGSFTSKKPLPEKWRGASGEDLTVASGVAGAIFCHAGGFCAAWNTRAAAFAAATTALLNN